MVNRKCNDTSEVLNCLKKIDMLPDTRKKIGEGTYGKVYSYIAKLKDDNYTKVVLKSIKLKPGKNVDNEVEYSFKMGNLGIGPKVYDAFYTENGDTRTQYIIMEYFNTDAAEAIYKHIKRNEVESLLKDMLLILKKQIIVHKLYCSDIKSENYVVNVDKHGKVTKVRMIDFGERFCIKKIFEKNKEVKQETRQILFYILMGIQLVLSTNVDNKTMLNVLKADKYIKNIKKYKKELLDVVYNIQVSSLFHYLRTYSHSLIYALESVMTDTFEKDIPDLNIVNKNKEVTLSKIYSNLEQKCAHARFDIAYNLYMAFNKLIELGGQKYSDEYYLYQLYIELFPNKRDSTVSFKKLNTEPFDEARFAATNIPPKLLETVRKLRTPLYLKTCYNLLHGTKSLYGKSAERVYRTIVKQVDNSKYINNRHLALYIIKRIDDYNSKEFHKIANFMGINMKEYKNPV